MNAVNHLASRLLVDQLYYRSLAGLPCVAPALTRYVARGLAQLSPSLWSIVAENSRLALGESATSESVNRTAATVLWRMQEAIRDTLASSATPAHELEARVTAFSGQEGYHQARRGASGMLVVSIHMGAFEPCLALLRRYEKRVHVLFQPDPMPRFERARSGMRRSIGVIEHRLTDGVDAWLSLRDALEAGEVVVMHADRVMNRQHGARMPFLGLSDAVLPTGPVRLAVGCGAAIVPTYCRQGTQGLSVEMDDPIRTRREVLRNHDVASHPAQRQLLRSMERAIRASPDQWLAFWRLQGASK